MRQPSPTILLIEDDEFDRMTLTRMLEERGYGVIAASRGKAAVDTFAINHHRVALVLASTGLSDVERIRLDASLYQIDPYVPVVIAARRALHRPNSGEDSGRSSAFATLVAEVQRLLHNASARAAEQAQSFAEVQPRALASVAAPADEAYDVDEIDETDGDEMLDDASSADEMAARECVFFPDLPDAPPLPWSGSSKLTRIPNHDPRIYLTRLSRARRARRKRISRIGLVIAAACVAPLVVPPLLELQTRTARATSEDAPIQAAPLASASMSARIGIVPLVSTAHLNRRDFPRAVAETRKSTPLEPVELVKDEPTRSKRSRANKEQ